MAAVLRKFLRSSFFLFSAFITINALYFHVSETESKCFIEEVPEETLIVGKLINQ